jgi:hypothetical protein
MSRSAASFPNSLWRHVLCAALPVLPLSGADYQLEAVGLGSLSGGGASADYRLAPTSLGYEVAADALSADYGLSAGAVAQVGNPEIYLFAGNAEASLPLPSSVYGSPSAPGAFVLILYNLAEPVVVSAPPGFEISTTADAGFGEELEFDPEALSRDAITLHARTAATTGAGAPFGDVLAWSDPALPASLSLIGDIARAAQTIAFDLPSADVPRALGSFALSGATSASGLSVVYASSDPSVASVSGSTVTLRGAGVVLLTASQPGAENYLAAEPVQRSLVVTGPIAVADALPKPYSGAQMRIPVEQLLANDLRVIADGSTTTGGLTIVSVTPGDGNGVSLEGARIFYVGEPESLSDSFTYVVSDGVSTAAGIVTVTTADAPPFSLQIVAVGVATFDGAVTAMTNAFLGVPNQTYEIEYKASLGDPEWTSVGAVSTGPTGSFSVTITASGDHQDAWNRSLFFRARRAP